MPCDDMTRRGLFVAAVRQEKQQFTDGRTSLTSKKSEVRALMTKLYGIPGQARGRICLLATLQGGGECLKGIAYIIYSEPLGELVFLLASRRELPSVIGDLSCILASRL